MYSLLVLSSRCEAVMLLYVAAGAGAAYKVKLRHWRVRILQFTIHTYYMNCVARKMKVGDL